jgi:hypothetical protein
LPQAADFTVDEVAVADIGWLKAVLSQVRRIRGEYKHRAGEAGAADLRWRRCQRSRTPGALAEAIAFLARVDGAAMRWLGSWRRGRPRPAQWSAN